MRWGIFALGLLVLLAACKPAELQPKKCLYDSDCVCGGLDKGQCFLGNREYYDKFVDKTKDCPDFCGGIAGNLEVKCVSSQCIQQVRQETPKIEVPVCGNGNCETGEDVCASSCPKDAVCELSCGTVYCPEDCNKPAVTIEVINQPFVGQETSIRLKPAGQLYSISSPFGKDFSIEKLDGNWQRMPHQTSYPPRCDNGKLVPTPRPMAPITCAPVGEETMTWSGKLLHQREKWCANATYAEEDLVPPEPGHYRIVYRYHLKQDCGDNPLIATAEFDILSSISAPSSECTTAADCGTGGCSGQVCGPKDKVKGAITTCEFTKEYECLKTSASCGCVKGKCAWDKGQAFEKCING